MKFSGNLARVCRTAFEGIIVDPSVRINRISVVRSGHRGCRHADSEMCLIVRVFTNDASMLKGAAQAYKGSYKERVEGAIDFFVRAANPAAHAYLEIIGPGSLSVERLVPIKKLLQFGKLGPRSPIAIAGQSYGINYCLIRGRHLIGPCPAVSVVLRRLLSREKENIRTVLDIFSGTGLATKVVCLHGHPKEVTVIDNDERKISRMKSHMGSLPVQLKVGELCLLLGRQFVLDAHEQGHLLALNFAFRGQHLFQLREDLLLVDARLPGQRDQLLHFILQLPLQLREFQLRGADFRLEIIFL